MYQGAWLAGSVVVDSGPVLVAGQFTHNWALCDSALKHALYSGVIPAAALSLPLRRRTRGSSGGWDDVALQDLTPFPSGK